MIEGQVVDGLFLRSWARPIELDRAGQKRDCVLDLRSPITGGSTIYDVSGKGNHGTITGATWVRLPSGVSAQSFTTVTDTLVTVSSNSFISAQGTFRFWWKQILPETKRGIFLGSGTDYLRISNITTGRMELFIWKAGVGVVNLLTGTVLTTNKWHFIAITQDGITPICYVDGIPQSWAGTSDVDWTAHITDNIWRIGPASPGNGTLFDIALIRQLNRALSASEIAQIYNQERHLFGV